MTVPSRNTGQEVRLSTNILTIPPTEALQREYAARQALFAIQPQPVKSLLETQAGHLVQALFLPFPCLQLTLPDPLVPDTAKTGEMELTRIPPGLRDQAIYTKNKPLSLNRLDQQLSRLEQSPDRGVSTSAALLRYAAAIQLIDGRFPPAHLEAGIVEVETCLASLQRSLWILQAAGTLAPYIAADAAYQKKCCEMMREVTEQGFALAAYETQQIIDTIKRRAEADDLNRGLSLRLPYFDDQTLRMKTYDFEVIPAGRISFEPGYVMWVARYEQTKVEWDERFSDSTRRHLLAELMSLEKAFEVPGAPNIRKRPARRRNSAQAGFTSLRLALNTISMNLMKKDR